MSVGAYGLVEVRGAANAILVTDRMAKAADVTFAAEDHVCGGHVVIFMAGDVAAVKAAVESVTQNPPCEVYNTFVISSPSEETEAAVQQLIDRRNKKHKGKNDGWF